MPNLHISREDASILAAALASMHSEEKLARFLSRSNQDADLDALHKRRTELYQELTAIAESVPEFKVIIEYDESCENPRTANDNLGTMCYWEGSDYKLGDVPVLKPYGLDNLSAYFKQMDDHGTVWLPVYAYIHSGIDLRTTEFCDRFDSGMSGYIHATQDKIRSWFVLADDEPITDDIREAVKRHLASEVHEYNLWQQCQCWGVRVEDEDGETVESCYGFIGDDDEAVLKDIQAALEPHLHDKAAEAWENRY